MGRCMVALEKENNAVSLISTPDHFNQLVIDKCVRLVLAVRTEKHITIGGRAKVCWQFLSVFFHFFKHPPCR